MTSHVRGAPPVRRASPLGRATAPAWGLLLAALVMVLAVALPALTGWRVDVGSSVPPLRAEWAPRVGPGTLPALVVAVAAVPWALAGARRLHWRALVVLTWLVGVAWMLSLALVDGTAGIGSPLDSSYDYLATARVTTDVPAMLREFVSRIPQGPDGWPVHVAGHPPGALLFFVLLARLGLGSGLAAGLVVMAVAATTPVAVLVTARALGAEAAARVALPFLVLGPAAIWQAVSADAVFAAVAAWGAAALALGATRRSVAWSLLAGLLLGFCTLLSYGLVLLGVLATGILVAARSRFPLPFALGAAAIVVGAFAAAGFEWWTAFPVLQERYASGVSGRRPGSYWLWGNLAALLFSAGPLLGAALASAGRDVVASMRGPRRNALAVLVAAGASMAIAADATLLSKGEVERIWLPFVPWLMVSCAFLPAPWRKPGLVLQVVFALVVQHLLRTAW